MSDDEEEVDEVPLPILPKTTEKMKARNRCSSFYQQGNRRASAVHPKSPLDAAYVLGCNDDLLSNEASATHPLLTSTEKAARTATKNWL